MATRTLTPFVRSKCGLWTSDSIRGFVYPSVSMSVHDDQVGKCEKRIFAPAHPSATGVGRVSGLVNSSLGRSLCLFACANHSAHSTHSLYSKQQRTMMNTNKAGYTATSCGQVGRSGNARFHTFQSLRTNRPMDRRTDKASYVVEC